MRTCWSTSRRTLPRSAGVPQNKSGRGPLGPHASAVDAPRPDRPDGPARDLLHDIGKPSTLADGHFIGHDSVGAELAGAFLDRLRSPRPVRERIVQAARVGGRPDPTLSASRSSKRSSMASGPIFRRTAAPLHRTRSVVAEHVYRTRWTTARGRPRRPEPVEEAPVSSAPTLSWPMKWPSASVDGLPMSWSKSRAGRSGRSCSRLHRRHAACDPRGLLAFELVLGDALARRQGPVRGGPAGPRRSTGGGRSMGPGPPAACRVRWRSARRRDA